MRAVVAVVDGGDVAAAVTTATPTTINSVTAVTTAAGHYPCHFSQPLYVVTIAASSGEARCKTLLRRAGTMFPGRSSADCEETRYLPNSNSNNIAPTATIHALLRVYGGVSG